jgi:hypothetical protein
MKKTMILALSAIMMAAGTVTVNAQEKVVTLDQLLKSQQQKQAQTPQKQETAKPATETKAAKPAKKETAQKPKASAAAAGVLAAPVAFSSVYLQYNFESQKVKSGSHSESESGNSVSAGYNYAFPISSTLPLYVEAGIAAKYVWKSEDGQKFNMLSAKVPVNLLFSYPVNESFAIEPYAGIYLRGNIFGKLKYDSDSDSDYDYGWDDDDDWDDDWDNMVDDWSRQSNSRALASKDDDDDDSIDLFSKDDMGDAAWKRIQLGMQFGVRARISNKFLVGIGYSMDLTNISKYEVYHTDISSKFHSFDITLGYCF